MAPDPSANKQIELSAVTRLLLVCARPALSDALRLTLRALVVKQLDWDTVLKAARRNFVVLLLRKHLLDAAADVVPSEVMVELDRLRNKITLRAMEVARIQRLLTDEIFGTRNIAHVFIKGATLSQQCYGDRYLRQYRDIDVLIDDVALVTVATDLVARGYVVSNPEWAKFKVKDLAAFCRYTCALELRAPSGILLELHRTLDNTGCVFPSREYLAAATARTLEGEQVQVLPITELFVYVCFHHSRHAWSSLHWCADLHAFWDHPEFDLAAISTLAERLGMGPTLAECLKLRVDLESLALHAELPAGHTASLLLPDCLAALADSIAATAAEAPPAAHGELQEPDFPHAWQKTPGYRWRFQRSRWHPTANDFNAWPLPVRWHWLYYLLKPLRIAAARLTGPPATQ